MNTIMIMFTALLILNILPGLVRGHGKMIEPVNRATRWRDGFVGPIEYNDNELFCGGANAQWDLHSGQCGVCGDEFGAKLPKFSYPGKFAKNPPIVRTYNQGQQIKVKVDITANHKGYFTFRVAALINPPIKQEDLDKNVLKTLDGDTQWPLPKGSGVFTIALQLPLGLTCQHCVLQWWYTSGNNYLNYKAETFVNCADIAILSGFSPGPAPGPSPAPGPAPPPACPKPVHCPKPVACPKPPPCPKPVICPKPPPCPGQGSQCRGVQRYHDEWCRVNCARGYCPSSHCINCN